MIEHVPKPTAAIENIHEMLVLGGYVVIATPFLFRVHGRPHDYHRWTTDGMRELLMSGGFSESSIQVSSWGNKACAKAHIGGKVKDFGFGRDLSNDPEYPMVVWAFAKRTQLEHNLDPNLATQCWPGKPETCPVAAT